MLSFEICALWQLYKRFSNKPCDIMKKTINGFSCKMKNSCFLLLCYGLAALTVLNVQSAQCEELVDIQSWADFQIVNLVSVSAVAEDCKQIFDSSRADSQKVIDEVTKIVQSTDDAAVVPPKVWDALTQLIDILKNASKKVRFHFSEIGEHFLKRLDGAISIAKFKKSEKIQELQNIFNSEPDTTNESVLLLEKSFNINYNPNSNLQQCVVDSVKQNSYSRGVALTELQQLSTVVTEEIDNLEKTAIQLLNRIYKGVTVAKDVLSALKATGKYPEKWDEQYIKDNLQNCNFMAKTLKNENKNSQPEPEHNANDADVSVSADGNSADQSGPEDEIDDNSGCGAIFRKTEKRIMKQLVIAIKQIKSMKNAKEVDSRTFKIFKNYSSILSDLNKKVITNIITVVNQFFQLYDIVLSILDKINAGMKAKANELLYITDVDSSDSNYAAIIQYIVEDYLSTTKMTEFYQKIDNHIKSMKSLTEIKKAIVQELSVTTNQLDQDLQTMKSTILYVFEEIKKGVKALQNLKNKSNITGFRYYFNFYKGKADLAQLKKLIHIINSLNIELLLERQLFNDEDELRDLDLATNTAQSEIDQENEKLLNELNTMSDFKFVRGFVSKSILEYNMLVQSYSVKSRKTLKKVVTKYVTVFEEIIIIIKRKKIKNAEIIENSFNSDETMAHDEIISKYLLEQKNVNIEELCSTLNQERTIETKETAIEELQELNSITHTEVNKIKEKVLNVINTISKEIHNLESIKEEASKVANYEISNEQSKCISNIVQLMNSLQLKSNQDEIQSLSIYFEKIKEKIQLSMQNFETQTSECNDAQQFKSQVETLKTSVYEALTKASFEINEKIRRVIFEYNEKLYTLQKNSAYTEFSTLKVEETTFTLNDNTRKYITGCYTSAEIFQALNNVVSTETNVDISQLKTDVSTQLDDTNQKIESELNEIHQELNHFVAKFSEGMKVVAEIENIAQKESEQVQTIDQAKWDKLREVNDMVKVISKYVNIIAENSEKELKVQIDNARLQISKQCEQVSQAVTSLTENSEIESTITQSINICEKIFNELKYSTKIEIQQNTNEFLNTYQQVITTIQTQQTDTQNTFLQDLSKESCQTQEDKDYKKYMQLMHQQNYESTTTVTESFSYLKKYNSVDNQNIKEKCTQVFQSLSNKMNLEIDSVSYVSKYMLESLQKANKVLLQLENNAKQSTTSSLSEEELNVFRQAKSIAESWKYSSQDNTMSIISSVINTARNEMDIEYKKLQTKIESTTDESIIQTEVETSLQNIETILSNTQVNVNEKMKESVSKFYTSISTNITEFESSGSETLYSTMQSILNGRSVDVKTEQTTQNIDFDSFTSSTDVREIYEESQTETVQESSDSIMKTKTNIEILKQKIDKSVETIEKTSTYIVENFQKASTIINEIKNALQQDSNYQLTQYQQEQLNKCVSVYRKVERLSVNADSARERITNNINLVKSQISDEYTKITEFVSPLTDEKAIEESVVVGINKFEQLYAQAKETVKEQLSLTSANFYSSFTKLLTKVEQKSMTEISTTLQDIKTGKCSYQTNSDQSYLDTFSYFNSNSFKSGVSVKNWYNDIHSSTSTEAYYCYNERSSSELSILNEQINSSFEKMESSSTYVLESIKSSTELLKQIEVSIKQVTTSQLTQEQIVELQRCVSIYKSIQIITSSSTLTTTAQETIQSDISNVKNEISNIYSEITQSISSSTDERSIEETVSKGIKRFEKLYSKAKETVKEELSQTLTSFYSTFNQISTDLQKQSNNDLSVAIQQIKNGNYQSGDQSFQDTVSYFSSESFKSCVTITKWFNEARSSTTVPNNTSEKTINELSTVNEQINSSLEKMENSSVYILESIQKSSEILKHIENSFIQSSSYQLSQENIVELQKCISIHQTVQSSISTSTSTSIAQQAIQNDINNVKEEISTAYSRITQSISTLTEESSINNAAAKGVEKYEQLFSQVKGTVIEQLHQVSSSFYDSYTQISSDLQQQSNIQNVIKSDTSYQSESDQSFTSTISCFKSDIFKSNTMINKWYQEIHTSTTNIESTYLSEQVVNDFTSLNDRVTQSIQSMQENSAYILETIKKGSDILKQMEESAIQDSKFELTEEQVTYLQKCSTIYQTIQTVETNNFNSVSEAKQMITNDITNVKNQINEEFSKIAQTIQSLSDESSVQQAASETVNHVNEYFSRTKEKVQSQLTQAASSFYNEFQGYSANLATQNSQISGTLQSIMHGQNNQQIDNDQSYANVISYLSSDSFSSNTVIQNWYKEIKSSNSNNQSSNFNERCITELNSLNERVTKSAESMEQSSTYVLDTIEKGSEILKQVQQASQDTNYQLNQNQIISLQKCISVYQTITSITVTSTSTNISEVKQTITADISNVKSHISDEFNKVTQSISSLTDEVAIKNTATESVTHVNTYFSQTKEKIQFQLSQTSSSFYQEISSFLEKQKQTEVSNVLQEITSGKTEYQSQNDQSFTSALSYFSSDMYKSNNVVQCWYSDIESSNTNTASSSLSETTVNNLSTLNERVTKSIDTMEESSSYTLNVMEKASEVFKQIKESSIENSNYQLNEEQITYLKKCVTIYHAITSTTTLTNTSVSSVKQAISQDISNAKTQINDEFSKVSQKLSSLTDENSIKETIDENVVKVDEYYCQAKEKVQTQLTQTSTNFFNSFQQVSSNFEKNENSEINTVLHDIINTKTAYQGESDESFTNVISFINSDSYKLSTVIQNWYSEIHSSSSTSTLSTCSESAIYELSTLNDKVTKSIDTMEENSAYILETIEKGSEVLKELQQSTAQQSSYQLSQEQIISLQKSITIYQSIQSVTTSSTSTTVSNNEQNVTSINNVENINKAVENVNKAEETITTEVGSVKSHINEEYVKVSDSIHSLSDESSIKKAVNENLNTVDRYYNEVQEKVQSELTQTSSNFFNSYQQVTSDLEKQGTNDINSSLREIINDTSNQIENDESFTKVVSYLNSDQFKSKTVIQTLYQSIRSGTSTSQYTNLAEQEISKLGTVNEQAAKSVDTMEENSKYILNTIKNGSEVLKQAEESVKQGSSSQLTQDQMIELKKCITIYQIIQSVTSTTTSTTVTNNQNNIASDQNTLNNQNSNVFTNSNTSQNAEQTVIEGVDAAITSNNGENNVAGSSDIASNNERSITTEEDVGAANTHVNDENNIAVESNISFGNSNNQSKDVTGNTVALSNADQSATGAINNDEQYNGSISSVTITTAEENITNDVTHAKSQITDEFTKVSQSISSLKDEASIKKVVNENVVKVDQYYSQVKGNVQSQLTETSTGFFTSCQQITNTLSKQENSETNKVLQEIINGQNTYQVENDETFTNALSYLKSDTFKTSGEIQNWYQEIQSGTTNADSSNLNERSVNELTSLNERVTKSVDTMEERSKYILETMKKGTEIMKQIEESAKQNSSYQLTSDQIVELQKCISIYQTIQTITTTSTTTTNTVEVSKDSVTNQSTFSDEEYEYVVNVTKNTKQVVQVEETMQEENEISIINNQQISEKDIVGSATTSDSYSNNIIESDNVNNSVTSASAISSINIQNEEADLQSANTSFQQDINTIKESTQQISGQDIAENTTSLNSSQDSNTFQYDSISNSATSSASSTSSVNIANEEVELQNTNTSIHRDTNAVDESTQQISGQDIVENTTASNSSHNSGTIQSNNISSSATSASATSTDVRSIDTSVGTGQKDVLSEFDVSSNKSSTVSTKNSNSSMKRTSHSSKINLLKKYSQDQTTYSKTSLSALMVNWQITKSTTPGIPNTCQSLNWDNDKYSTHTEEENIIKEIEDLLSVGRSVIEDTIELKKEKLPLYRDIDEIELIIVSCTEVVDEVLLQLSEVVGEDIHVLKSLFYENLNSGKVILDDKVSSLDQQFLTTVSSFFSMKNSKKTDLLNQINKQFGNIEVKDEKEARELAIRKFDKLQSIMNIVLDNIDCLTLRVIDTIINAKNSLDNLQNTKNSTTSENLYIDVKNGQVLCDTFQIPVN